MNEELKQVDIVAASNIEKRAIDKVKENFHIFGVASFIYACFYAFCMFDNFSGITYVLFAVGTVCFIGFCLKKLEVSLKRGSIFYIVSMILISISTFCTDDFRIIFFNKIGMLLLVICFLLDTIYETKKWRLGKFLSSIVSVCLLSIGEICSPFEDAIWYFKNKWDKRNYKYIYLIVGIGITIPLFFVVSALLASADAVFRNFTNGILESLNIGNLIMIGVMIGFMFMASYCVLSFMSKKSIAEEVHDTKRYEPLIAIPVSSIMTVLYLVFSVIQIMYLFIGNMNLPEGYTYAEYAREGFFQLLAVSILNLIMVLVGLHFFKSSRLLKGILAVMSLCTIIMIASSAMRMIIYIQYYYLTFLRIMVLWSLLVLLLIFVGVFAYIFKEGFPLFRYSMVVVTILYLCLAFSHPDYQIAKVNLAGTEESGSDFFKGDEYDDFYTLSTLSADAAPAIVQWMNDKGYTYQKYEEESGYRISDFSQCMNYVTTIREKVDNLGIRNFNLSRYIAMRCLDE